jgi:hypothetical protein
VEVFVITDPKQIHSARMSQLRNHARTIELGDQTVFGEVRSIVKSGDGATLQWVVRIELKAKSSAMPKRNRRAEAS